MSRPAGMGEDPAPLVAALGGQVDRELVELALTHRSYAYENGGLPTNERLEFLGDSVLGVVVTDTLFRRHADLPEGQLAKLRAAVVNARALATVARRLEVGRYLKLGRGEETSGGRDKLSILADALEALIGAYYLDRGTEATRELVLTLFADTLDAAARLGAGLDWKTSLQELASEHAAGVPEYRVAESGPDHAKLFRATALVGGRIVGHGEGSTKKEAEQRAAAQAWSELSTGPAPDEQSTGSAPDDPTGGSEPRVSAEAAR